MKKLGEEEEQEQKTKEQENKAIGKKDKKRNKKANPSRYEFLECSPIQLQP